MANVQESGSTAVYTGFWTDHDGRYLLTLTNRNAAAFLSFLAVAVTFAGNRSWKVFRFIIYVLLSHRPRSDQGATPSNQAIQAVLRNASTAGATLWSLLDMLRPSCTVRKASEMLLPGSKAGKGSRTRASVLSSISMAHLLGFIGAGILTSRTLVGRIVVSRVVSSCGQWQPIGTDILDLVTPAYMSPEMFIYQSLKLNETYDADNYVRNCYPLGVSRGILDCGRLSTRQVPYKVEHDVVCPYGIELCTARPNGAFALDSGSIAFRDLGINSRWAKSLSIRRRSVCAVVPDTPFIEDVKEDFAQSYRFWHVPDVEENPALWYINDTLSGTYNLRGWRLPFKPNSITQLLHPDPYEHDTSIILLRSNAVWFPQQFDDPWFSVHKPWDNSSGGLAADQARYETDNFLNIIACKESMRFCSTLSGQCTEWGPISRVNLTRAWLEVATLVPVGLQNGTSDYIEIANLYEFVQIASVFTSVTDSISGRPASSALQASRYLQGDVQVYLDPEQWKLELEYWFATALARLQLEVFNTIEKPPGIDESIAYNFWQGTPLQDFCGKVKFYSPNHTSLSTVGIIIILVTVVLLTLGSIVDTVLDWIPMSWARNLIREWNRLEYLKLLEEAEKQWAGDNPNNINLGTK